MENHLHYPQGSQEHIHNLEAFDTTSNQQYYSNNNTWPLIYAHQQTMSDHHGISNDNSNLRVTTSGSLDSKPSIASPMAPLRSPAFDLQSSGPETSVPSSSGNTSTAHGRNPSMATSMATLQLQGFVGGQHPSANLQIRTSMGQSQPPIQSPDMTLQQAYDASATMIQSSFGLGALAHGHPFSDAEQIPFTGAFDMPLHSSPTEEYLANPQMSMAHGLELMGATSLDGMTTMSSMAHPASAFAYQDLSQVMTPQWHNLLNGMSTNGFADPTIAQGSPEQHYMDARSLSSLSGDEHGWTMINPSDGHQSFGNSPTSAVVSPSILHARAGSEVSNHSDHPPPSARSRGSFDEIFAISPEPEFGGDHRQHYRVSREYPFASNTEYEQPLPSPPLPSPHSFVPVPGPAAITIPTPAAGSPVSSSSIPSAGSSPKSKRRTSPSGVTSKVISKKKGAVNAKDKSEKRVGRRRGPLRPEQREQAHEIRKLRACLRCKFLKKVCDKGNPCGGCQPSHARLWQVPCTRIDIKDIGYFLKDWNTDYERHITLGFSIANIKGFDKRERLLYITHGYGFVMPIWAREVFVRDEKCFGIDWVESIHESPQAYEVQTAKLSAGAEGISKKMVSDYVDLHLDSGFDHFITEYFEGTPFLSELLKSINRHYMATRQENIRKGLRLVIAYALTLHITMINGLSEAEAAVGKIEDPSSRYFGETCAPVMINFEVKKAMADLWRELMKEVLEELSTLYSSVYAGSKQKNWPTIFMLAALILSVWEMMQFDCHYRMPDEGAVTKFCGEMEHIPVGVIVGLFGAISTKLPGFQEWDSKKHGAVFNDNPAVCETMTEVRSHIEKHDAYLRTRNEAKFCRDDFDSLSNKFLSKLVIRA